MSIFSTLSNLIDLSFDDDYAMMLGYTEAEIAFERDTRRFVEGAVMQVAV